MLEIVTSILEYAEEEMLMNEKFYRQGQLGPGDPGDDDQLLIEKREEWLDK